MNAFDENVNIVSQGLMAQLCCKPEPRALLVYLTCLLRPRQKFNCHLDGLVHILRVLRGAVWVCGASVTCGESFVVCCDEFQTPTRILLNSNSFSHSCSHTLETKVLPACGHSCLLIEAGVEETFLRVERWLPERNKRPRGDAQSCHKRKTLSNQFAHHSEFVLPAFWRSCMCGTFAQVAYDMYSGRHKKTSVSVNGPTYMGSNIFARILSNSVYTLFGFVAVIDGGTGGSEVSLPGFICLAIFRLPLFAHLERGEANFLLSRSSRAIFMGPNKDVRLTHLSDSISIDVACTIHHFPTIRQQLHISS